jgi:BirA family biotin operon repressor/biotin-[acetyl-CoA-carboxylase] ligase
MAAFSLVAALAVAKALKGEGLREEQLKWPNDLWWQGRKLAGLLLEARGGADPILVVGLGLNLRPPDSGWPAELRGRAISLEEGGLSVAGPEALWAKVLNALEPRWELFCIEGFAAFQQEWRAADLLMGREVEVQEGERRYRAWVDGVDPRGRLLVRAAGEPARSLEAGEVHLDFEEASSS